MVRSELFPMRERRPQHGLARAQRSPRPHLPDAAPIRLPLVALPPLRRQAVAPDQSATRSAAWSRVLNQVRDYGWDEPDRADYAMIRARWRALASHRLARSKTSRHRSTAFLYQPPHRRFRVFSARELSSQFESASVFEWSCAADPPAKCRSCPAVWWK